MKLIIDIDGNVSSQVALKRVARVIEGGRVSEAAGILHYCWVTTFEDGVIVNVRHKKSRGSADSFLVYKDGGNE